MHEGQLLSLTYFHYDVRDCVRDYVHDYFHDYVHHHHYYCHYSGYHGLYILHSSVHANGILNVAQSTSGYLPANHNLLQLASLLVVQRKLCS